MSFSGITKSFNGGGPPLRNIDPLFESLLQSPCPVIRNSLGFVAMDCDAELFVIGGWVVPEGNIVSQDVHDSASESLMPEGMIVGKVPWHLSIRFAVTTGRYTV